MQGFCIVFGFNLRFKTCKVFLKKLSHCVWLFAKKKKKNHRTWRGKMLRHSKVMLLFHHASRAKKSSLIGGNVVTRSGSII